MRQDGILLLNKNLGWSSHDIVAKVRKSIGIKKIGHAGTLDPMATGLLVLGVNRGTKFLHFLTKEPKTYSATIRIGVSTTTDDAVGNILNTYDIANIKKEDIYREVQKNLTGYIDQIPSLVSAIKVNGKRAYKRFNNGETFTLKSRKVFIRKFDLTDIKIYSNYIDINANIDCSSGTYIRALARDLGILLKSGAHITSLKRTSIGMFNILDSVNIEELNFPENLISLENVSRKKFPIYEMSDQEAKDISNKGKSNLGNNKFTGIYSLWHSNELIALAENVNGYTKSKLMIKI